MIPVMVLFYALSGGMLFYLEKAESF